MNRNRTWYGSNNSGPGAAALAMSGATQDAYSATLATFLIDNIATKAITMEYVRLQVIGIGATITSQHYALSMDNGPRYSSGGTLSVPVARVAGGFFPLTTYAGAITMLAASSDVSYLDKGTFRNGASVAMDDILFDFSGGNHSAAGYTALAGRWVIGCGNVVVPPGKSLAIHYWGTGMTGAPTACYSYAFSVSR